MLAMYRIILFLALPFVLLRLLWRSRLSPGYRQRIAERFGFYDSPACSDVLVIHAVSVGEVMATKTLVEALLHEDPYLKILMTCMTPTGSARAISLYGDRVLHCYLPYDYPFAIRRFLNHFKPKSFIIMETEWWPNLFLMLQKRHIPLYIVNARLSEKSFRGYQRIKPLTSLMLGAMTGIAAQSEDTRDRLIRLGMPPENIKVTGSIKYDMDVHPDLILHARLLRETWGPRPVWIVASTHASEEEIVVQALTKVHAAIPHLLTIWVPRHLERFIPVKQLCEARGHTVARRSLDEVVDHDTQVYLADTMGELMFLYGCADLAFVGGSMLPIGGHNVLEPAILGVPVITGEYLHNFKEIAASLLQADGMVCVKDADTLAERVIALLSDPKARQYYVNNAAIIVNRNRGATQKIMALLHSTVLQKGHTTVKLC